MLKKVYKKLYQAYGPQQWWPGDTPFEVIIGAILTQNTNWTNVEKAIINLKKAGILSPPELRNIDQDSLAELIRPSGYFNIKANRLKNFIHFLFEQFNGNLDAMFSADMKKVRNQLLQVKGIGPETADSILLYAGNYPLFVVDAYTKRIFSRLTILDEEHTYHQVQDYFMAHLEEDAQLYNEYHALIVRHGKEHCKTRPLCKACPLLDIPCPFALESNAIKR